VEPDVLVVGGGPIGLSIAWRAGQRGLRVLVVDAGEPGAWHAAAGMLAPATEAEFGEPELLDLGLRSAELYPDFCAELGDVGYRPVGTLTVARDADEAEELERLLAFRQSLGLEVERLRPSQARRAEPGLAPTVRLALDTPGDHSVDPRRLVAELEQRVAITRARVREVRPGEVVLESGLRLSGGRVVVAAGAWSGLLGGMPVRPVKGQVLRLRDPAGPGLVSRTIRTRETYLVPRDDGSYVLGASMEERGWDTTATVGALYELVRETAEVVPGLLEMEIEESCVSLRPATPDNLPIIGEADGLVWATGHHRNGILLTPVTAELVAGLLAGEPLPDWVAACAPGRFSEVAA
jgi:glycine oxidase